MKCRTIITFAVTLLVVVAAWPERADAQRRGGSRGSIGRSGGGSRGSIGRSGGSRSRGSIGRSGGSRSRSRGSIGSRSRSRIGSSRPRSRSSFGSSRSRGSVGRRAPSRSFGTSRGSSPRRTPSFRGSSSSNRSFGSSRGSFGGSRRSSGSSLSGSRGGTVYRPFGSNRGPTLYKPRSSGRSRGTIRSPRLYGGRGAGGSVLRGRGSSGSSISPRSRGTARGRGGFTGFQSNRNGAGFRDASSYRNALSNRVNGRGGSRRATPKAGGRGAAIDRQPGGRRPSARSGFGGDDGRRGRDGGRDGAGRDGHRGDGRHGGGRRRGGHRRHRHHDHHRHHRHRLRLFFGFPFGFGFYYGHHHFGFFGSYFHWYYPYYRHYYYPYYGYCYYPYYYSYRYYPSYRHYGYGYGYDDGYRDGIYATSGYLPGAGYEDDPYAEPEVIPDVPGSSTGATGVLAKPIVEGVFAGENYDQCLMNGDGWMKSAQFKQAAEAYRQAYDFATNSDALQRLSLALLAAGDYPLSSWALVHGLEVSTKRLLDTAVLMDELLGGPQITKGLDGLESYLVENPNDEASNLLLGAMYVLTGKDYAGYVVLTRLRAAGYERATTEMFIKQAELALKK